jgi:Amiloride-sensitive sodium channel
MANTRCLINTFLISRYEQSGCVSPSEWAARYVVVSGTQNIICAPLCNVSDSCYSEAAEKFRSSLPILSVFAADCDLQCSSIEFVATLSSVLAPPEWLMQDIKTFVESSSIPLPTNWSTTWQAGIQANYVAMDIVFESTRVTSFTQKATLGAIDVLASVGSQSGLWIGISFLSLMEIAEMLYRVIRFQLYRIQEKILKRTSEHHT